MLELDWLRDPTKPRKRKGGISAIPSEIRTSCPIINQKEIIDAFKGVKITPKKSQITFIKCPQVTEAAIGIPFLLYHTTEKEEYFKGIIAAKSFSENLYDKIKKLSASNNNKSIKLFHFDNKDNKDAYLSVCSPSSTFINVREALDMKDSHLTHLIIEGFDGEKCLDMEILWIGIQLARKDPKFKIIILNDGMKEEAVIRAKKLCGSDPICIIDLLRSGKMRANRFLKPLLSEKDVFDTEVNKPVDTIGVDVDSEAPLTFAQMKDVVFRTVNVIESVIESEKGRIWTTVVFAPSAMSCEMVAHGLMKNRGIRESVVIYTINADSCIKYIQRSESKPLIVIVSGTAEDSFIMDGVNFVVDMGLVEEFDHFKETGHDLSRVYLADGVIMRRRANLIQEGTIYYPFEKKRWKEIRKRMISRSAGYDLELRYLHENKEWMIELNEEKSNRILEKVERRGVECGLVCRKDSSYCTPLGSFCWGLLSPLPPRLAKLILAGIVTGCGEEAITLAAMLHEKKVVSDCSGHWDALEELVEVKGRMDHLAMIHAWNGRATSTRGIFRSGGAIFRVERTIRQIREKLGVKFDPRRERRMNGNVERRVLLALTMALGDTNEWEGKEWKEKRGGEIEIVADTNIQTVRVYYGVSEKYRTPNSREVVSTPREISTIPLSVMGAVGNIGGRVRRTTKGMEMELEGGEWLHIEAWEGNHTKEMLNMRREVEWWVERTALSYLVEDEPIKWKDHDYGWVEELCELIE